MPDVTRFDTGVVGLEEVTVLLPIVILDARGELCNRGVVGLAAATGIRDWILGGTLSDSCRILKECVGYGVEERVTQQ